MNIYVVARPTVDGICILQTHKEIGFLYFIYHANIVNLQCEKSDNILYFKQK